MVGSTLPKASPFSVVRRRTAAVLVALAAVAAVGSPARAEEVSVQNDSVVNFSQVAIQAGFAAGEMAASWLTSPCDGDLVAVQVFWRSVAGGTGNTVGDSIQIFESGTFPVPGTLLQTLPAPLMTDGFLNEFRYIDEAGQVPLVIPLTTGEVVVVAFKFDLGPLPSGPSVVNDIDGCQAGKNAIFAIPPSSWFSACLLGVSGDFVIRAIVDCPTGGPELIFEDGFEGGDAMNWSDVVP